LTSKIPKQTASNCNT